MATHIGLVFAVVVGGKFFEYNPVNIMRSIDRYKSGKRQVSTSIAIVYGSLGFHFIN